MRDSQRRRRDWMAAMAAGLALRAFFCLHHPRFDGDTLVYGDLAGNLLHNHIYGLTENVVRPTLIRLPGYPLFLLICFVLFGTGDYLAVVWVQVAVGLASCWMLGRLAARLCGERVGLLALWLACVCPFTANYDAAALTETWSLFCVVAAFFGLERWWATRSRRWVWTIGAALAYAVLVRPEQGLLAAAVVPVMAWVSWRERRGAGAVMLAALLVVLPLGLWGLRNWRVFHVVQPLAPKNANDPGEFVSYGFDRWYRTWGVEYLSTTDTYWLYDGAAISLRSLPGRAMDNQAQRDATERVYAAYNRDMSAGPEVDAAFAKLAAERARERPLRTYVLMPLGREADMWLRPRTEFFKLPLDWWRWREHPGKSLVAAAYGALDWLYLGLAAVGLCRWKRLGPTGTSILLFVAMRSALLLTIDNSEPRYTLECFPAVFLLAACALAGSRVIDLRR